MPRTKLKAHLIFGHLLSLCERVVVVGGNGTSAMHLDATAMAKLDRAQERLTEKENVFQSVSSTCYG